MQIISDINELDTNKIYTYADYLTWQFSERLELIKGKIFKMSPAPNVMHQRVSGNVQFELKKYFLQKPCQVFAAPFDVRLYDSKKSVKQNKEIFTVVQPDLCVICDDTKLDEHGCIGAPDLIVEVLSPGNTKKEMKTKFQLYEENEVREYWLIEPIDRAVLVYTFQNEHYIGLRPLTDEDIMNSPLFPDMQFNVEELF